MPPVTEPLKPMTGPVTVEKAFQVDGKRLTVQVTFPAAIAAEIGLEHVVLAANRCLVNLESKQHRIEKGK